MYSNCLLWALRKFITQGGWVKMRWSHWGPFPHFLWSPDDQRWFSFSPVNPRKRLLPPPIFKGQVKDET